MDAEHLAELCVERPLVLLEKGPPDAEGDDVLGDAPEVVVLAEDGVQEVGCGGQATGALDDGEEQGRDALVGRGPPVGVDQERTEERTAVGDRVPATQREAPEEGGDVVDGAIGGARQAAPKLHQLPVEVVEPPDASETQTPVGPAPKVVDHVADGTERPDRGLEGGSGGLEVSAGHHRGRQVAPASRQSQEILSGFELGGGSAEECGGVGQILAAEGDGAELEEVLGANSTLWLVDGRRLEDVV